MLLSERLAKVRPIIQSFPELTQDVLTDVVRRADLVLGMRPPEDVDAIAAYGQSLIDKHLGDIEDVITQSWETKGDHSLTRFSPVRWLYIARDLVPFAPPPDLSAVGWPEIFAAMALQRFSAFLQQMGPTTDGKTPQASMGALLAYGDALEAVTLAETLAVDPAFDSQIRAEIEARFERTRQQQTQPARSKRHSKTNAVLCELVAFYKAGGYENYQQATADFLGQVPEERVHHLAKSNRQRTLSEGLSQALRGLRALDCEQ